MVMRHLYGIARLSGGIVLKRLSEFGNGIGILLVLIESPSITVLYCSNKIRPKLRILGG